MLRVLFTPRWLGWTLLAAVGVVVCGGMAYWQILRAESPSGSFLNAGYAFQWPLFGVFFAALWWRMLRAEARTLAAVRDGDVPVDEPAPIALLAVGSPFTPRPRGVAVGDGQGTDTPGSARAEYNAMFAELARREATAATTATTEADGPVPDRSAHPSGSPDPR